MRNNFFLIAIILLFGITSCSIENSSTPVLLLATDAEFGTYTAEMLKTEGFNEFQIDSLSDVNVTHQYLKKFDVVILGKSPVTQTQKSMLSEYVKAGGNIIAFMPDKQLSGLFGLDNTEEIIREGYIVLNPSAEQCKGITSQKMQFHGSAGKYELNGGNVIATLYADEVSEEGFPGVVSNNFGKGHAIAFLYNLPQSIVYTRQGNPLSAGIEKDGIPGLRGMDLFTDGWLDTTTNTLNQADQQMALLTNCIQKLSENTKPIPRFWYFPDSLKCLAVLDNDGEDSKEADFEPQFCDVDAKGAKMTVYFKDVDKVSKEWVDKWTAKGFEIAAHPDDTQNAAHPTWSNMDSALTTKIDEIRAAYGLSVRTNVNHWFVWCGNDENGQQDFGAGAKLEEKHGIEMDANYAFYDQKSNQPENYLGTLGYNQGNYTGSGLVMKYADVGGKTVNVYQRFNAVYDQQYNESHDPEGFFNSFKGLVDRSLNDDIYSVISIKSHNNEYYFSKEPLMKMLDYAKEKGIPVWTALNLLNFLKMKDEASFSNLVWSDNQLSFSLNSSLKHSNGLTFIVPARSSGLVVKTITTDGVETPIILKSVKGREYAFVTVTGGSTFEIDVKYGD